MSEINQIVQSADPRQFLEEQPVRIVLASASPRRLELLGNLGLKFDVIPSKVDETIPPGVTPTQLVQSLASEKAHDVLASLTGDGDVIVIGADTMVVLDGDLIGKPGDEAEARSMLARLSARTHIVFTGVTVLEKRQKAELKTFEHVEQSLVTFRNLTKSEISAYVATREPLDKAGAYALQGIGAALVARIEGCYTNIIGLPIPSVVSMLRQAGVNILGTANCQDGHLK